MTLKNFKKEKLLLNLILVDNSCKKFEKFEKKDSNKNLSPKKIVKI